MYPQVFGLHGGQSASRSSLGGAGVEDRGSALSSPHSDGELIGLTIEKYVHVNKEVRIQGFADELKRQFPSETPGCSRRLYRRKRKSCSAFQALFLGSLFQKCE